MKCILVATANTENLIMFSNMLQRSGYVVIPGMDGDLIRSILAEGGRIDAVIADFQLPDFPGLMRAVKAGPGVAPPVIAVNDRISVTDYLAALSLGAYELFFLPVRAPEFLRALQVAINSTAQQGQVEQLYHAAAAAGTATIAGSFMYNG